jgi:protein-S-isoprenylcysteine O-methyltransferase Ste14
VRLGALAGARLGALAAVTNGVLLLPALAFSPARAGAHGWTFFAFVSAFAFFEAASARGDDVSTGRASHGPAATGVALLVVFATALLSASTTVHGWALAVGAIAMAGGIALRCAAMMALGPAFVSELRPLTSRDRVVHGPYRWLEHPSEIGLLVLAAGAVLVLGSTVAALVFAVTLVPIVLARMRHESRAQRES